MSYDCIYLKLFTDCITYCSRSTKKKFEIQFTRHDVTSRNGIYKLKAERSHATAKLPAKPIVPDLPRMKTKVYECRTNVTDAFRNFHVI